MCLCREGVWPLTLVCWLCFTCSHGWGLALCCHLRREDREERLCATHLIARFLNGILYYKETTLVIAGEREKGGGGGGGGGGRERERENQGYDKRQVYMFTQYLRDVCAVGTRSDDSGEAEDSPDTGDHHQRQHLGCEKTERYTLTPHNLVWLRETDSSYRGRASHVVSQIAASPTLTSGLDLNILRKALILLRQISDL